MQATLKKEKDHVRTERTDDIPAAYRHPDADCTLRRKTVKNTWPSFFCGKPVDIFLR